MHEFLFLVAALLSTVAQGTELCIAGGFKTGGALTGSVYCLNNTGVNGSWYQLADLNPPVGQLGLSQSNGNLLRVGGRTAANFVTNVEIYSGGIWTPVSGLNVARGSIGVGFVNGVSAAGGIMAAGGLAVGGSPISSAEVWNGSSWNLIASMNASRAFFALTYFPLRGLCATGGWKTTGPGTFEPSWECCVTAGSSWLVQPTPFPQRRAHSAIYLGQAGYNLCVAGGENGTGVALDSVMCSVGSNVWVYLPGISLPIHRFQFQFVAFAGMLCAIGGWEFFAPSTVYDTSDCIVSSNIANGVNVWVQLPTFPEPRYAFGATLWDPPTLAPTKSPTLKPSTAFPTLSPTSNSPTHSPTSTSPTSDSPTTQGPTTQSPTTFGPTSSGPTKLPTTSQPTLAPSPGACLAANVPPHAKGSCGASPPGTKCEGIVCTFGVAEGDPILKCTDGVWSNLVCNSVASQTQLFNAFPLDSWQGIVSLTAICGVFVLCVILMLLGLRRCRKKKQAREMLVAMTALPTYTEASGDFVFPDHVAPGGGGAPHGGASPPSADIGGAPPPAFPRIESDPFAAEKSSAAVADSERTAAEKVRNDQIRAYQAAADAAAAAKSAEEGKHGGPSDEAASP